MEIGSSAKKSVRRNKICLQKWRPNDHEPITIDVARIPRLRLPQK